MEGNLASGDLPQDDGKAVHVTCPLVYALRTILQHCTITSGQVEGCSAQVCVCVSSVLISGVNISMC